MTFLEACTKLNITDYANAIFNSNSRGELFHLYDYVAIAESFEEVGWFRKFFEAVLSWAKENWSHPERVYQHMLELLQHFLDEKEVRKP